MPVGYQTNTLNRQAVNVLATPGLQKNALSPGANFGASSSPGGTPMPTGIPGANNMAVPGSFAQPGSSSFLPPSSSVMNQQQTSLGGGEQQGSGMPPSMSQYADSSNISTLLRALTGNKDRVG